jgi:hypothetical protein
MHNNIHIVSLLLLMHKIYLWPHKLLIIKNNDFVITHERKETLVLKISKIGTSHVKLQTKLHLLYTNVAI